MVTFYGNGGMTSGNEGVVSLPVKKGTLWRDVLKPEFLVSGFKKQNGYTFVQGNDNTVVDSSYVVKSDVSVWASYTVVEFGIITQAGEIMTAYEWIEKYGKTDGTGCYEVDIFGNPIATREGMRDNLIRFCYFKLGDVAFAIDEGYMLSPTGSNPGYLIEEGVLTISRYQMGAGNIDLTQYGFGLPVVNASAADPFYPGNNAYSFPFLWDPPQVVIPGIPQSAIDDIESREIDAKACCAKLYDLTHGTPNASPVLEECMQWSIPGLIPAGSYYIPSHQQAKIIFENRQRIIDNILKPLWDWSDNFLWTIHYNLSYGYAPFDYSRSYGFGHFPFYDESEAYDPTNWTRTLPCMYPIIRGYVRTSDLVQTLTMLRHTIAWDMTGNCLYYTKGPGATTNAIHQTGGCQFWNFVCDVSHLF